MCNNREILITPKLLSLITGFLPLYDYFSSPSIFESGSSARSIYKGNGSWQLYVQSYLSTLFRSPRLSLSHFHSFFLLYHFHRSSFGQLRINTAYHWYEWPNLN